MLNTFELTVRELRAQRDSGSPVFVVHYACDNIFNVRDQPPGVSSIAVASLFVSQVTVWSVIDRPQDGERYVLESFFTFLHERPGGRLVHWNMNSADFGFQTLANRYAHVLNVPAPKTPSAERLIDLDELIALGYGRDYADHPRLPSIARLNDYRMQYFLSGKEEAEHYGRGEHGDVRRSVSEKVSMLAWLTRKVVDGTLETRHSGQRVAFAGGMLDSVQIVVTSGQRMLEVARQLTRRHSNRPTIELNDEYDAQDLFHSILRLYFDDIRKEDSVPTHGGSASRIDFVLPRNKLAVELKHSRPSMSSKDLGDELIADAERYKKHPDVRHLVCLVFDSNGYLENPRGIETDLSHPHDGLAVTVRIFER